MSPLAPAELSRRLQPLIERECGAGATVVAMSTMEEGHAGLTFGFAVVDAAGQTLGEYVLKVAPLGVVRKGNTDVYRQAPLLRALKGQDLPVPAVPWASPNEDLLGTPFIIMEKLPGRMFLLWDPHPDFDRAPSAIATRWLDIAALLARFHQVDAERVLRDWEAPRTLSEELAIWPNVLKHAQDPAWLAAGSALGEKLLATQPANPRIGLVHGDYQPGNMLYEQGQLTGVIDWELAGIGAQLLDVGWLMMVADPANWVPEWHSIHPLPPAEIQAIYEAGMGQHYPDMAWYQAYAGYRLGSIGCLNVKLHRKGQRPDPIWESMSLCLSRMFERARVLLQA